jgi:hypothetical protein
VKTNRRSFLKGAIVGLGTLMVSPLSLLKAKPAEEIGGTAEEWKFSKDAKYTENFTPPIEQASDGSNIYCTRESLVPSIGGNYYQAQVYIPKSWDMSKGEFEYEVMSANEDGHLMKSDSNHKVLPNVSNFCREGEVHNFLVENIWGKDTVPCKDEFGYITNGLVGLSITYRRKT